ncbi:MAG: DUF2059 domain-containing protein [Opitutaceae bacterium]|nr:DUF2059 domain-containing protein [Opitutaceae bacterium]MBP9912751.1 DUF2059 domain-containing protein [Opitutaceae bacterium]
MKLPKILLATFAFSIGAFAQENTAKLTLAREAIAAMHVDKMFDAMAAQMKQMTAQMVNDKLPPQATPEERKILEEFQGKTMDLSMELAKGMIAKMDQVYADIYSEAELQAMITFFKSPEGQSMLEKQPQVMQRIMPLVQSMQRDLAPKIQPLIDEMKVKLQAARAAEPAAPENP